VTDSGAEVPSPEDIPSNESEARKSAIWIAISVIATGALVGWLTGLSESPVAGIILPLIIALVAGAGGFQLASKSPVSRPEHRSVRLTAQSTVLFVLACAVGLHFGILVRSRPTPRRVPETTLLSEADAQMLTPEKALRFVAIEKRLLLLGVDGSAVKKLRDKFVTHTSRQVPSSSTHPPTLADLDQLESAIKDVIPALENARLLRTSMPLNRFKENIPLFLLRIAKLREYINVTHHSIPREVYKGFLAVIEGDNHALIEQREGNKKGTVLTPAPQMDYIALYALDLVVQVQKEPLNEREDSGSLELDKDDAEIIDGAIRLGLGIPKLDTPVQPKYAVKH